MCVHYVYHRIVSLIKALTTLRWDVWYYVHIYKLGVILKSSCFSQECCLLINRSSARLSIEITRIVLHSDRSMTLAFRRPMKALSYFDAFCSRQLNRRVRPSASFTSRSRTTDGMRKPQLSQRCDTAQPSHRYAAHVHRTKRGFEYINQGQFDSHFHHHHHHLQHHAI